MEIKFVYTKNRSNFGRHPRFSDNDSKVLLDIGPNDELSSCFVDKKFIDRSSQHTTQLSEHETNTELHESASRGINHTEGGWPKDINSSDLEQVARFRKKTEKDENYIETVKRLAETMEQYVLRNNSLDIYKSSFGEESVLDVHHPTISTMVQFCDPNPIKRPISSLSWFTDGPKKVATSYVIHGAQEVLGPPSTRDCYVWDVESPNKPEVTLHSTSQVACLAFNPKEPYMLAGGLYNGQVVLWDSRGSGLPFEVSNSFKSHRDVANCLVWIQSKTGNELFTSARDGQVLWWDTRKMSEVMEVMYLDPTRNQDPLTAVGAECLEYDVTMPTKFLAGCVEGSILICNRKAKSPSEKISGVFGGSVKSPVYGLQRNPFYPKYFLSSSGYQARLWSEDWKESSIWSTRDLPSLMASSCWSPVRPSVFYSTNGEGVLSCWNLLANQNRPICDMKVSKKALRCIKAHEQGKYLVVGGDDGIVSVLQVSDDLNYLEKNEKKDMLEFFERETKREKNLELIRREKRTPKKESEISRRPDHNETEDESLRNIASRFLEDVKDEQKMFHKTSMD